METMESPLKKVESLLSYDQEKLEVERRKRKPLPGFRKWETRRSSIQAYMCLTMNFLNMLQFSGALIIYGGVVWVSYIIWAMVLGLPMIKAEMTLGHYINNEIRYVWRMCRVGKGIFWNSLLLTFVSATLCHVYLTILFHLSFQPGSLQIKDFTSHDQRGLNCSASWSKSYPQLNDKANDNTCPRRIILNGLPGDWNKKYLFLPKSQLWNPSLYLIAICFLMVLINSKGIQSLQKVTIPFFLVPYFCAVILAMLILTLPGAVNYIGKSLRFHWSKLLDFWVWFVSFKTIINLFSIGSLSLIFVSVHSDYQDDIMIDIVILFLNIFLNTVLYTITFLGLIGLIDNEVNKKTDDPNFNDYVYILTIVMSGLAELPPPNWLWKFLFYSYLIGSVLAQQTFMVAAVSDVIKSLLPIFSANKFYVTTCVCIIFALLGICIFSMEVLKLPRIDSSFVTIGFLQSITIFWIYNYDRISSDYHFLMGYKPSLFYQIIWVLSPIMFLCMMITSMALTRDFDLLVNNSLYLTLLHTFIYVLSAVIELCISWRKGENLNIFQVDKTWGPTDPLLKQSRIIFMSRIITKEHIYRQKLYEEQLVKPADITDQNIVQLL